MKVRLVQQAFMGVVVLSCALLLAGCPCANAIKVHNDTLVPINEVHVKYQVENDYGPNLLSSSILPTETENLGNFTPGRFDIRLVYVGGATSTIHLDVLCKDEYTVDASSGS